ncbi:hypothetical protein EV668_3158 [Enterovirga rhinocerotis]|uniref:Uncharacterized protein n=1 Tax=Enterovirga rhinocerotis TaxID=1339210 RepID=A0A4R7BWN9_9HYPH|nr:hypothetical protein EV668_3158 [Enterovirga rhinocerotis]
MDHDVSNWRWAPFRIAGKRVRIGNDADGWTHLAIGKWCRVSHRSRDGAIRTARLMLEGATASA